MSISVDRLLSETISEDLKKLKDSFSKLTTARRTILSGIETGDLDKVLNALTRLNELKNQEILYCNNIQAVISSFNFADYCRNGFHEDFMRACSESGVVVSGNSPDYEVFPFLVRVIPDEKCVLINKRKVKGLKLSNIVKEIKKEHKILMDSPFGATDFLKALSNSYQQLANQKGLKGQPMPLTEIYDLLTPMGRWKREYPKRLFAFDIYRLIRSDQIIYNGRRCEFGFTRYIQRAFRVVNEFGQEAYYGSLNFRIVEDEEEEEATDATRASTDMAR